MNKKKKRHGCLTTYLVFMSVINALLALVYLAWSAGIGQTIRGAPGWLFPLLAIGAIANVIFAVALFRWKKWGFYGFCAVTIVVFIINLSLGLGIGQSITGFLGLAILYWVLNMGGEQKAWPYLE